MLLLLVLLASADPGSDAIDRCVASGTLDAAGREALLEVRRLALASPGARPEGLDAIVSDYPRCPVTWLSLAAVEHAIDDADRALAALARAVAAAPHEVDAQVAYGLALLGADRAPEARAWLRLANEQRPDDTGLVVLYARSMAATGDGDGARTALQEAWAARSRSADVAIELAMALEEADGSESAFNLIKDALLQFPDDDRLARFAFAMGHRLGRSTELADLIRRPVALAVAAGAADAEIVVEGDSAIRLAREALEAKFIELGYLPGRQRDGRVVYHSKGTLLPNVTVFDNATVDVARSKLVEGPNGEGFSVMGLRKLEPRRVEVLRSIWPYVEALREAVAAQGFRERMDEEMPVQLEALWTRGRPLTSAFDAPIPDPHDRRAAMVRFWTSRTCSAQGEGVRAMVEEYLAKVVQESEWPLSATELATYSGCGDTLGDRLANPRP